MTAIAEPAEASFPKSEHLARFERAKSAVQRAGLDCCVAIGPEMLYYLAGYDAHTHFSRQALVFGPGDEEPAFIVRDVDVPVAEDTSWVRDMRVYHHGAQNPAQLVAAAVRERTGSGGRVGVELNSYALAGDYALDLVEALKPSPVVDASSLLAQLRLPKSAAEMGFVHEAAVYAQAGLKAAVKAACVGMSEIELAGIVEGAMRSAGTEYSAMPTWIASGPRLRGGHRTPSRRLLQAGDFVVLEFAGVSRRYHAVTMRTLALGDPGERERYLYEAAREALLEGSSVIRAGVPVADAERKAASHLRKRGFDPSDMSRFGYGVGIAYPPTWLEPLDIIVESPQVFEAGMSFVLHVGMRLHEERRGVLVGGAYVLSESGLECLSGGPLDLAIL